VETLHTQVEAADTLVASAAAADTLAALAAHIAPAVVAAEARIALALVPAARRPAGLAPLRLPERFAHRHRFPG
jgi:hypothetical protein